VSRRIAIVGAGQSGLQLALGLVGDGHEVTVVSDRTAEQVLRGRVQSSQCMFESALGAERALGLDFWSEECPPVEGIALAVPTSEGSGKAIDWAARLDRPAQSVDQRLKLSGWLRELEARGGRLVIAEAGVEDLERLARDHELVVVATGRGELGGVFARDPERSPYNAPQRALALTYVRGLKPRQPFAAVCFNLVPGVGEYFVFPALTTSAAGAPSPCEIMVFEGVPGGPMDCWDDVRSPEEHLARSLELLERFLPWERARAEGVELTDPNGILTGRLTPTVRHPVARLPSGAAVFGLADAVVLNDPITGQGSNNAAKSAEIYLERILAHDAPFDERWMQQTFDHYWRGYAQWVVGWTNSLLAPPAPHVLRLLAAAEGAPSLAATIANGFDDPRTFYPWWFDEREAERLIASRRAQDASGLNLRELRNAFGQYATGVTIVTARSEDGRQVGVTANSFSSLSLEPPLVLWALDRRAGSLAAFRAATHFGVSVLSAGQHHLSRLFATTGADKFAGTEAHDGPAGVPLLEGALAHFVCRTVRQLDAGDHVLVIGEVEHWETFEGEPLVFHSGSYRVTTRHPELD
jgi:flavin reductase (DIM6/NTAB) family NADH-FMN oxidoreductase RutF/2-polyprenyl-6-methoxyphenol hydroxylase-like FAD-dependent oxidoreductase